MRRTNPRFIAVGFGGSLLWLFLAISSWGDFRGFFANPARTGLAIGTIVFGVALCFSGASGLSPGPREMTSNRWVLFPFIIVPLIMALLLPYEDRHNWWTIGGDTVRYWGLAFFLIGGMIRVAAVFALGHRFSGLVTVQEQHELKMDGLYRVIRHPSYTGLILGTLGWCLIFRGGIGLLLLLVMLVAIIARIQAEERFLQEEFGEGYSVYCRQTRWLLLPLLY